MPELFAVLDFAEWAEAVRKIKPGLDVLALADLEARAEQIVVRATELAPVSIDPDDRHAGELKADIKIQDQGIDGRGPYVDVGTKAHTQRGDPYPLYVEFGTVKMAAKPFMRPAIAESMHLQEITRLTLVRHSKKSS